MPFIDLKPATLAVIPRGRAGDLGASGAPGDQISFNTLGAAAAATISVAVSHVRTAGYGTVGDGGAELYYRLGATPVPAKAWHFQSADGAWWEIANYQLNILAIGGKGDNATNNDSAFAAAADAIDHGWATILLPYGIYRGTRWDLSGKSNFRIIGDGGLDLAHTGKGSVICITRTDNAAGIKIRNAKGYHLEHFAIVYSSTIYSGPLLDISCDASIENNPTFVGLHFYQFGASTFSAQCCVYARNCVKPVFTACRFSHAIYGVVAAFTGESSASTAVFAFYGCWFVYLTAAIVNPGLTWSFFGCNFEPSPTNAPSGIITTGTNNIETLAIFGCTFSDPSAAGTWIDVNSVFGLTIAGTSFAGDITLGGANVIAVRCGTFISGLTVTGSLFSGCTTGVSLTAAAGGVAIIGNSAPNTTTFVSGWNNTDAGSIFRGNNSSDPIRPDRSPSLTLAQLPAAAQFQGAMVLVSNESGGAVPAFSDGANWRRVTDRAVVS